MKKKKRLRQKDYAIIIGAILSLVVVFLLFPVGNVIVITDKEGVDDITVKQPSGDVSLASIINSDRDYLVSDQDDFKKFLDETEPFGYTATKRFTIETATTLFDSNQKQTPTSIFLVVPSKSANPEFTKMKINEITTDIIFIDDSTVFTEWKKSDNPNSAIIPAYKNQALQMLGSQNFESITVECEVGDRRTVDNKCLRVITDDNGNPILNDSEPCGIEKTVINADGSQRVYLITCYIVDPANKNKLTAPPLFDAEEGFERLIDVGSRDIAKPLEFSFDYSILCQNVNLFVKINAKEIPLSCGNGKFSKDISEYLRNSETTLIGIKAKITDYQTHSLNLNVDNIKLVNKNSNNLQPLSFFDDEGHVLDLGSIQVGFFAIANFKDDFDVEGTVEFWLDDKKIATKKIFAKPDGKQEDKKRLYVDDAIKREFENPSQGFTFTFSDEGANWSHDSVHYFRVILFDVKAKSQQGDEFNWSGEKVVYTKKMTVDERKLVAKEGDDSAVAIFKSDITLTRCVTVTYGSSSSSWYNYGTHSGGTTTSYWITNAPNIPAIEVYANGKLIGRDDGQFNYPSSGTSDSGIPSTNYCSNTPVKNIPRFQLIELVIGGEKIPIYTPKTQINYLANCAVTGCSSNFGWGGQGEK